MSNFVGLTTAASALWAHQRSIAVIGENIANINTPGFAAQRVELGSLGTAISGVFSGPGWLHGVDVTAITRRTDELLAQSARDSGGQAAHTHALASALADIEGRLAPLGEGSLHTQLNRFFNSFDDIANNPDNAALRIATLSHAEQIAGTLNAQHGQITTVRHDTIERARIDVADLNRLADAVATLNTAIKSATIAHQHPNALLSSRDEVLSQMASLADITIIPGLNGAVNVSVAGAMVVAEGDTYPLELRSVTDPALADVGWERIAITTANGRELDISSGRLAGWRDAANTAIPDVMRGLNDVAEELISQVNVRHQGGFGLDGVAGRSFFAGTGAYDIAVHADIAGQPAAIGASHGGELDGSVAAALADLTEAAGGPLRAYESFIGTISSQISIAGARSQVASDAASHAQSLHESAVGVNLDEELTQLMASQRAYEAAARMITAVDEMLDTLINRTGIVGR